MRFIPNQCSYFSSKHCQVVTSDFRKLPKIARNCQESPRIATKCLKLPKIVRNGQELPKLPKIVLKLAKIAKVAKNCQKVPENLKVA